MNCKTEFTQSEIDSILRIILLFIVCTYLTTFLFNIPFELTPNYSILPILPSNQYTTKLNNSIKANKEDLSPVIEQIILLIEQIHFQSLESDSNIDLNSIYEILKLNENIIEELVSKYKPKIDKLVILLLSISRDNNENINLCFDCLYLIFSSGYYDVITSDVSNYPNVFIESLKDNDGNEIQQITPYETVYILI